jgi:NtrC-family two-component system sensor histidine kinase KinB
MISLRVRLWLGFGGLLLVLLIAGALGVVVMTRYNVALESMFRDNYDSAVYCNQMMDSLDRVNDRTARRALGITEAVTVSIDGDLGRFDAALARQISNAMLPGEMDRTRALAGKWNAFGADFRAFVSAPVSRPDIYSQRLLPACEAMKSDIRQIAEMNLVHMAAVDGQVRETLAWTRNCLLALVGGGTALAAFVVWAVGASLLVPLRALTRSAQQIEAGDLEQRLVVSTKDEIGQMAAAFNAMTVKLREFRRLDHDRLRRTQQTTQLAIDSLPDAVFVVGLDENIEISNRVARALFGAEPGAALAGLSLPWLIPLYAGVKANRLPVDSQGYKGTIQLFVAGEERFLLPRVLPMLGDGGNLIGVAVVVVDITRLRQVDEAKSSVISTVSHELRTPLTSIRLSLSLLAGNGFGPMTSGQQRLVAVSREETDRLCRIIENLLNISRLEAGRSQFNFQGVGPAEIIANAVDPLRGEFAERRIELTIEVDPGIPPVRADLPSFGYALSNLLTNAMKFTPAGGRVSVHSRPKHESVAFEVNDNGPGIPPEYRQRIFEKFFRIPTESGPTGAGLGLSIAKEIIEAHGGQIDVSCPPDGGTTFRLIVPLYQTVHSPAQ